MLIKEDDLERNKIKCSVYLRNSLLDPASFYRFFQYADYLDGIFYVHDMFTVNEYNKNMQMKRGMLKRFYQFVLLIRTYFRGFRFIEQDRKKNVDVVIVQRTIIPRVGGKRFEKKMERCFRGRLLIWDFDDNIIASGEIAKSTVKIFEKESVKIVVTHDYLMHTLDKSAWNKVLIMPTTDMALMKWDSEFNIIKREKVYDKEIRLIWNGTSTNLVFLRDIVDCLDKAAATIQKKMILVVVCNQPLNYKTKELCIINKKWERNLALNEMEDAHIGIMPLEDNEYTRGKGAFKLIQYMGMGLPVVGSAVGYNKNAIDDECGYLVNNPEEWQNAIRELALNLDHWTRMSKQARKKFENCFNPQNNIENWKSMLHGKEKINE